MQPQTSPAPTLRKPRDVRVDFFRGAALLIIFVAHVPGNWLGNWIPARFGMSDAAHMFVFISGYAAAIAFGGTFVRHGFVAGTARIAMRCLQLYGAHIAWSTPTTPRPVRSGRNRRLPPGSVSEPRPAG